MSRAQTNQSRGGFANGILPVWSICIGWTSTLFPLTCQKSPRTLSQEREEAAVQDEISRGGSLGSELR